MSTPRFRLLAAIVGVAASLFLVTPAHAVDFVPHGINDGEAACTKTGFIFVPWHINTDGNTIITDLDSVPSLNNFVVLPNGVTSPWENSTLVKEFVPNGTTSPALTFTWTDPETHETGTGSGTTTQGMPKCDDTKVTAKYTAKCNKLVDVTLHNGLTQALVFRVNGVVHTVGAGTSVTIKDVAPDDGDDIVTFVDDDTFGPVPTDMFHWTAAAENCATSTPSNTTAPPALAVTGTNVTGIIGAGGGLLVLGALLVVLSVLRRRRQADTNS